MSTIITSWIDHAELDYYTLFINSWIPFNTWYMHNYYDENENRTSDRAIIDYIKENRNDYKDSILTLLNSDGDEGVLFRQNLADLHYALKDNPIPNAIEGVSFSRVCISPINNTNSYVCSHGIYTFKGVHDTSLPKTSPRWIIEVIRSSTTQTIHRIALHRCSAKELDSNICFREIDNDVMKSGVREVLNEISSNKMTDLVVKEARGLKIRKPSDSFEMGNSRRVFLKNNRESIAKAVIQILYELRNKLFHGEIDANKTNKNVYMFAFYIQRVLVKCLA